MKPQGIDGVGLPEAGMTQDNSIDATDPADPGSTPPQVAYPSQESMPPGYMPPVYGPPPAYGPPIYGPPGFSGYPQQAYPPGYGYPVAYYPGPAPGLLWAGIGRRLAALMIDAGIVFASLLIAYALMSMAGMYKTSTGYEYTPAATVIDLFWFFFVISYHPACWYVFEGSVGQR